MRKNGIRLLLFLQILYSCEYSNNIVHTNNISPPDKDFYAEINLSHVQPNCTLYIYEPTVLTFAIDPKGHEIVHQTITIDAESTISDNRIYLYPLKDNSVRKLVFDLELKTNTGSIAENLGYEKYTGRYEYNVKFVKLEEEFDVNFRGGKSDEGYLELEWDEPILENASIQKYELLFFEETTNEEKRYVITDPSQTHYIDENYVWGYRNYKLSVYYSNSDVDYESYKSSYFTPSYYGAGGETLFSYQYIDHEWMNVSWAYTGYKCKYLLVDANGTQSEWDENHRTVKMQRFRFPVDPERFKLYILPYHLPIEEYEKCSFIAADIVWNDGRYVAIDRPMAWNREKDEYYYMYNGEMKVHSMTDFSLKNEYFLRIFTLYDQMNISSSSTTSQVALYKHLYPIQYPINEIYIYDSSDFVQTLKLENVNRFTDQIRITDNFRLFYKDIVTDPEATGGEASIVVCDSRSGSIMTRRKLMGKDARFTVSNDGKYICEYYEENLHIYRLDNDVIIPVYSYRNLQYTYKTCQFSHINSSELIISGGNETILFDVVLLREKYKIEGQFIVQDAKNGYLACLDELYHENSILNIFDMRLEKVLTRIPFILYDGPYYLLNNMLFFQSSGTTALDISTYLNE